MQIPFAFHGFLFIEAVIKLAEFAPNDGNRLSHPIDLNAGHDVARQFRLKPAIAQFGFNLVLAEPLVDTLFHKELGKALIALQVFLRQGVNDAFDDVRHKATVCQLLKQLAARVLAPRE